MNRHVHNAGDSRLRHGLLLGLLVALLFPVPAAAAADVRLIVDVSASMGRSDPDNQRGEALGMLLRLLPEDGEAGVWTYGKFVNMLVKHDRSDRLWKENAAILTGNLESVGQRSNLLEAVDRASWDRTRASEPADLILLTDGRLDVSDEPGINAAQQRRLLAEVAPELAAAGYRVHTLALSDRADGALLGQLAALTGGYHGRLDSASELPRGLLALLGWVAGPVSLPAGDGGRFQVAPGVRDLTVLRLGGGLRQPVALVDPTGTRLERTSPRTRARWHVADGYEMVSIADPAPGSWRFEGPAARVFAYGDLAIEYRDFPGTLFPASLREFELNLMSNSEPIEDKDFLGLLEVSAWLRGGDADVPLVVEPATDGRYRVNLIGPRAQGDYVLETRVQGPTFTHTLALPFALRNPLTVEVHPAEDGFVLWARVAAAELDHGDLRLSALVKRPPGAARLFPLQRLPAGLWKLALPGARGLVEISLDLNGKYLNDRPFELRTQPIRVVLPVTEVQYVNLGLDGRPVLIAAPPPEPAVTRAAAQEPPARPPSAVPASPAATAPAATPEASAAQPAEPAAVLPLWLGLAAALVNLALGLSVWWLVGGRGRRDTRDAVVTTLRQRLGLADPDADDAAGAVDAGATPAAAAAEAAPAVA